MQGVRQRRAHRGAWAILVSALLWAPSSGEGSELVPQVPLPGSSIPQFVAPLPTFAGSRVHSSTYTVRMQEFQQKILPDALYAALPAPFDAGTFVWGYAVDGRPAHYPGFTVEARRFVPTTVRYVNELAGPGGAPPFLQRYLTVDQTLHWAAPLGLDCMADPGAPGCDDPYQGPVPAAVHLHGAEVPSAFDGGPDQWFTPSGLRASGYRTLFPTSPNAAVYRYPNGQEATTLFFHDHALGATRLNVYAGLAAFYWIRDGWDSGRADNPAHLPSGAQELELAIQDRRFDTNGQWIYPDDEAPNPDVHPFWTPETFGDAIVVNGRTWPFLDAEPRRYRFRIVNGSQARFYRMTFQDASGGPGPVIWQIGTDGGLLDEPAAIAPPARLTLAPGERADVIVDFSRVPAGTVLTLVNDAPAPFPVGEAPDPATTGRILQVRVTATLSSKDTTCDPAAGTPWDSGWKEALAAAMAGKSCGDHGRPRACRLRPFDPIVRLAAPDGEPARGVKVSVRRQLVLDEVAGPGGPLEVLLNNSRWSGFTESSVAAGAPVPIPGSTPLGENHLTELPRVGSTEVWEIVNLTGDAHPIHLHLVQFQLLNRQTFDADGYAELWAREFPSGSFQPGDGPPNPYGLPNADGALGGNPAVSPFLLSATIPADDGEAGWKDTIRADPGMVTRIVVRFAPQDWPVFAVTPGRNLYPFDPTHVDPLRRDWTGAPGGPGYVWHCHILEHEDNEMMRPYTLLR